LNGRLFTGRAGVYAHILDRGHEPPIDLAKECNVQFLCAPSGQLGEDGKYHVSSVQATAAFRYYGWIPDFVARYGIRAIIGKTGLQDWIYQEVFTKYSCVFLTTVGFGLLSAIYGRSVKEVVDVYWAEELGLPEGFWILEVENFGPFIVEGDTNGDGFFSKHNVEINRSIERLYENQPEFQLKRLGERVKPTEEVI
jgi:tartrate dehydratase beta subunit/fumarate hydratase class I family protein